MEKSLDLKFFHPTGIQVLRTAEREAVLSGTQVVDTGHIALATLHDEVMLRNHGWAKPDLRAVRLALYDMAGYIPGEYDLPEGSFAFSQAVPSLIECALKLSTRPNNPLIGSGLIFRALCDREGQTLGNAFFARLGIEPLPSR